MLSDATVREGYVQGAIARGMEAAGSNPQGATGAFVGMGVGMGAGGGFMASASATNREQMAREAQMRAAQQQAQENGWLLYEYTIQSGDIQRAWAPPASWK